MRLNPNATATIVIGGLALCHQNTQSDVWEVVFLRDSHNYHNLTMKIPGEADVVINKEERITIRVDSPKSSTSVHEPGIFKRRIAENIGSDARWTLDFSSKELHNKPLMVKKRQDDNFMVIPNAKFYTWTLSQFSYFLQKIENGTPIGNYVDLEKIGQFMAGDIECDAGGSVSIEVGGKIYPIKNQGIVFFDNRCLSRTLDCRQDFHYYYDILFEQGGGNLTESFSLTSFPAPTSELQLQGLFGSSDNCESGQVGKTCKCPPDTCPNCSSCEICDDSIGGN